jgi:hypothetical protein
MVRAIKAKSDWVEMVESRHYDAYRQDVTEPLFVDLKWTERLTLADLRAILQTPGLFDFASQLGYDLARLIQLAQR